jgi:hypothetical protein
LGIIILIFRNKKGGLTLLDYYRAASAGLISSSIVVSSVSNLKVVSVPFGKPHFIRFKNSIAYAEVFVPDFASRLNLRSIQPTSLDHKNLTSIFLSAEVQSFVTTFFVSFNFTEPCTIGISPIFIAQDSIVIVVLLSTVATE